MHGEGYELTSRQCDAPLGISLEYHRANLKINRDARAKVSPS